MVLTIQGISFRRQGHSLFWFLGDINAVNVLEKRLMIACFTRYLSATRSFVSKPTS